MKSETAEYRGKKYKVVVRSKFPASAWARVAYYYAKLGRTRKKIFIFRNEPFVGKILNDKIYIYHEWLEVMTLTYAEIYGDIERSKDGTKMVIYDVYGDKLGFVEEVSK